MGTRDDGSKCCEPPGVAGGDRSGNTVRTLRTISIENRSYPSLFIVTAMLIGIVALMNRKFGNTGL